jgi:histidyl-tRNA synthetase
LKYASARGARVMGIVGENERTRGEISIRNLETREQQTIACGRAADAVSELLTPSSVAP